MATRHRDASDVGLHVPGFITGTDPASTYGTSTAVSDPGVQAGHLWIDESSTDTPAAVKYRNNANDGWVTLLDSTIPSLTEGDLLYADSTPELATLAIGTAFQLLQTNSGATAPEWTSNVDIPGTLDVTGATTLDGSLNVSGTGPHGIGGSARNDNQIRIQGAFADGGASAVPSAVKILTSLTAANGSTTRQSLFEMIGSITTQGNSETIADVATAILFEPDITVGAGDTVTNAFTLKIIDAPTEGTNNYALWVASGATELGGTLDVTGAVTLDSTMSAAGLVTFTGGVKIDQSTPTFRLAEADTTDQNWDVRVQSGQLEVRTANDAFNSFSNVLLLRNSDQHVNIPQSLRIGSTGAPSDTLDVDGTADVSGNTTVGGNLTATGVGTFRSNNRALVVDSVDAGQNAEIFLQDNSVDRYRFGTTLAGDGFRIRDEVNAREVFRYTPSSTLVETRDSVNFTVGGNLTVSGTGPHLFAGALELTVIGADPSTVANKAHVYAKDVSTSAEIFVQDEAGNATQLSPHDPETGEWIFHSVNHRTGRGLKIRVEAMLRELEERFGTDYIKEFAA